MGLGRYVVDAVLLEGRSPTELARSHGIARSWIYKLIARYQEGGYAALEPRSRRPKSCSRAASATVQAADVVHSFAAAWLVNGFPTALLTDNGAVFSGKSRQGKVLLETELERLGIVAKHSTPYHPQTCGKAERFHQTLKKYLAKQAPARSLAVLQLQLDTFRTYYNQQRPHRALHGDTPLHAFHARLKAGPISAAPPAHYRVRHDRVDKHGRVTLRYLSRLHHIGPG